MAGSTGLYVVILASLLCGTAFGSNVVAPQNIVAYLPITLTNYQDTAVAANTPIAIGATNAFSSSITGFNAIAYKQYESCNLGNAEFFLANGTVLNSWMEGNIINENAANSTCTSDSSANALADSANVLYWVRIPTNTFLAADTGTATQNTIYLGWAGTSTSLLSNTITGEAPQLSCPQPWNTVSGCSFGTSSYGYYDDGANVFNIYDNFHGNTLNTTLWLNNAYANITIANGILDYAHIGGSGGITQLTTNAGTNGANGYNGNFAEDALISEAYPNTASQVGLEGAFWYYGTWKSGVAGLITYGAGTNIIDPTSNIVARSLPISTGWHALTLTASPSQQTFYVNYSNPLTSTKTENLTSMAFGIYMENWLYSEEYWKGQWFRERAYPPNGIMPGSTFGSLRLVAPPPSIFIAANTTATDVGHYISITNTVSGGTSPFTYSYNAIGLIESDNAFTASSAGTYYLDENVVDNTGSSARSNLLTLTYNAPPAFTSFSPLTNTIAQGGSVAFTNTVTGGTPPYTYAYTVNPPSGWALYGNTIVFSTAGTYNVLETVTDAAGYTAHSANQIITVTNATSSAVTTAPPCGGGICGSGGTGVYGTTPPTTSPTSTSQTTTSSATTTSIATTSVYSTIPTTTSSPSPIEVSIKVSGQTAPPICNGNQYGYSINYTLLGAVFNVGSGVIGCFNMTAINTTSKDTGLPSGNNVLIRAINFTVSNRNITVDAVVRYPCSYSPYAIAPFMLKNDSWSEIRPFSVNAGACSITFAIPSDPTIAIMKTAEQNQTTAATSQPTTSAPAMQHSSLYSLEAGAIITLIVAIAMAIYFLRIRNRGRFVA